MNAECSKTLLIIGTINLNTTNLVYYLVNSVSQTRWHGCDTCHWRVCKLPGDFPQDWVYHHADKESGGEGWQETQDGVYRIVRLNSYNLYSC